MSHQGEGSIPARIMLVGEAWGTWDANKNMPFAGTPGEELNKMLHEAGIMRSECFVTNVVNHQPPGKAAGRPFDNDITAWIPKAKSHVTADMVQLHDKMVAPIVAQGYQQLLKEIELVKPNLIIALGNVALWALCQKWGVDDWRGSMLQSPLGPKVIPTLHPARVLAEWKSRGDVVNDLRRAHREQWSREYKDKPVRTYIIRPNFDTVIAKLNSLLAGVANTDLWLDVDLETKSGHIACCGISWSQTEAMSVPFMVSGKKEGYWSAEEETEIVYLLYKLMTHSRVKVRWQNGLYDAQYIYRWWHFVPNGQQDTMIAQHSLFSDKPKSLAYQASVYSPWYVYWKDEGKNYDGKLTDDRNWAYNCDDCVYTRIVGEAELAMVESFAKLPAGAKYHWPRVKEVYDFQQEMFWPVLKAMKRGIRILDDQRTLLAQETQDAIAAREGLLYELIGQQINFDSSKQLQALFYADLQQPVIMTRAKKGKKPMPTCDDEALGKIGAREPLLKPIVTCIQDIRTMGKFLEVILMKKDVDGRGRCSFNIGGSSSGKSAPKTYRLSSSESAFGSGGNMQNIPSEKSKSVGKALGRERQDFFSEFKFPNVRSCFSPDVGYEMFDSDLERADLHVFIWEIEDALYKETILRGVDAHLLHVYLLDGQEPPPLDELIETHPKYWDHRGPRKHKREFSKVFCHAVDYVGSARTLAVATGRTVHETDRARKRYLGAHPKIEPYWKEVENQLRKRGFVENKFGYRWYVFDRLDGVLPEAVAWIPQSTVSVIINKYWMNIFKNVPAAEVLLQVHDSLVGQWPLHMNQNGEMKQKVLEQSRIVIPYDDPLIIPAGLNTSKISWGDC